ncbi:methionine ABC transporter permease [Paenibacillus naphthalenovorans]|uniref:methionine ABC transporter permease n=1 Tax=Paenibacillus naphthalenovorans TaxID=162209 RepID=UPI003D2C57C7
MLDNVIYAWPELLKAIGETFYMLVLTIPIAVAIGTPLGTTAATVPMIINAVPYFARFIEQILLEVNRGVVEAAESMGANKFQIVWKVLYTEARSGIANSITIVTVSFLSYSTVAGLVGGGGIGDFAIRYGYYRYQTDVMFVTIIIMVLFVQIFQFTGNLIVRKLDKRL